MKKMIVLAALAALSACSQKAEEKAETAAPAAKAAPAEAAAATTAPGSYDVKMADGTIAATTINTDGTYVDTGPDGKEIKGKFANKDDKDCFDPDGDEPEVCWTVSVPGADGSFTATDPKGVTVTVTPKKS